MAARGWSADSASYPRQAEVVSQHRNSSFTHISNNRLYVFNVLGPARAVEKNVVPMCGIEILDGKQL